MKHQRYIILIIGILFCISVFFNDWDNPYRRPIIGDAKGYYAYLPAVFIYNDFEFSFIDKIEKRYYPKDGSLSKNFLVAQPNGSFVNKCFPGVSIFYLPFFLIAYLLSFLFSLPLDGYAPLFQWSIALAHLFYFGVALLLLDKILLSKKVHRSWRILALFSLTFASNLYFYLVYDFSVAHIFGFFGTSYFIWLLHRFSIKPSWKLLGAALVITILLIITRPTNILILLAVPLFLPVKSIFSFVRGNLKLSKLPWTQFFLAFILLCVPLVLWKLQTGMWLVYSYGDETLNFTKPHFLQFLFSVNKGWFFWSPIMLLMTICGFFFYWKEHKWKGIYFAVIICFIVYVFSCWWIWTFGGGLGQRPMIDFYPILVIGFAFFLNQIKISPLWTVLVIPFVLLNLVQAHQINKSILIGGQTSWWDYKTHFLQLKRDAPYFEIPESWIKCSSHSISKPQILGAQNHFSEAVVLDSVPNAAVLVVDANLSGKHESSNLMLVVSDSIGEFYRAIYPGNSLYQQNRLFRYRFNLPKKISFPLRVYIWNNDTQEEALMNSMDVFVFLPKK